MECSIQLGLTPPILFLILGDVTRHSLIENLNKRLTEDRKTEGILPKNYTSPQVQSMLKQSTNEYRDKSQSLARKRAKNRRDKKDKARKKQMIVAKKIDQKKKIGGDR